MRSPIGGGTPALPIPGTLPPQGEWCGISAYDGRARNERDDQYDASTAERDDPCISVDPASSGGKTGCSVDCCRAQSFELGPGEQTGFGFVAGKPGPIVVGEDIGKKDVTSLPGVKKSGGLKGKPGSQVSGSEEEGLKDLEVQR